MKSIQTLPGDSTRSLRWCQDDDVQEAKASDKAEQSPKDDEERW